MVGRGVGKVSHVRYERSDPPPSQPAPHRSGNRAVVLGLLLVAVFCSSLGDVAISQGMKLVGAASDPWAALLNPYLFGGVGLHMGFMVLYVAALSREELSFVLPVTGLDFVLVGLFAAVWAGEDLGFLRWTGTLLVSAGVGLVARS